ncbi:50S ribosomal protein L3 [Candidatus Zixiibacteriota bacterium]
MKGLIGRKLGMTQIFGANGEAVPVTVLEVAPNAVLQVKTTDKDGYEAIQVGYGRKKLNRAKKSNRVRAEKAGLDSAPTRIREFRTPDAEQFKVGDRISVDFFTIGDRVKVRGTSKGHGFSGAMKRHGFSGGTRASHGGGPSHRGVGSVGMSATPARTMKGRKLPGQYGNKKITEKNLIVVEVDPDQELLLVRGSVPGPVNGLVRIELVGEAPRSYTPLESYTADEDLDHDTPLDDEVMPETGEEEEIEEGVVETGSAEDTDIEAAVESDAAPEEDDEVRTRAEEPDADTDGDEAEATTTEEENE